MDDGELGQQRATGLRFEAHIWTGRTDIPTTGFSSVHLAIIQNLARLCLRTPSMLVN